MTENQALDKTVDIDHLYENFEIQEVLNAYTKDLPISNLSQKVSGTDRVKEVGDHLLLMPRDILLGETSEERHDFAGDINVPIGIDNNT